MSITMLLLIVLVIALLGGFRDWGPGPFYGTGNVGLIILIILIVLVAGGQFR